MEEVERFQRMAQACADADDLEGMLCYRLMANAEYRRISRQRALEARAAEELKPSPA